jgi:hypothetical protein
MRMFPDFQMEFVQATEFILSSELSRKAFESPPFNNFGNIIRDVIQDIDRLADNCHMPEFTDHALPHICSLVKRVSEWGVADEWLSQLTPAEAGYLLFSILVHDIGMLSQNPADLLNDQDRLSLGLADVAAWVRKTHVDRIEGLLRRLATSRCLENIINADHFSIIIALAKAHQSWPWQKGFIDIENLKVNGIDQERLKGLAAIIAVADLLDEGNNRCDTITLIKHRQGSFMNKAHWLRHSLTANLVGISRKTIKVDFVKPTGSENELRQVYRALRNHYRLIKLYDIELNVLHAGIERINFNTSYGVPEDNWSYQESWESLKTWLPCPIEQLLMTFMPEARNEYSNQEEKRQFEKIGLELLDLENYKKFIGRKELLTDEERIFSQLYSS